VAISVGISGVKAGALVGQSFFKMPGRKKEAGETLWVVLMPLQPANTSGQEAVISARGKKFQLNLTCRV
jgi:hypothetical protein